MDPEALYEAIRYGQDVTTVLLLALRIAWVDNIAAKIILKELTIARLMQLGADTNECAMLREALALEGEIPQR